MGISFGSINTGLPKDIVQQIMKAENLPIKKMEKRKEKFEAKIKLVSELIQLVEKLKGTVELNSNARSLRELKVDTNENIVDVAADKNVAIPGSYQFEVERLATKSSAMTSGFEDKDESYVGVGFIQYFLPDGSSNEIYVDADNSSLTGISRLINSDPGNGMYANVVNDGSGSDTPWRIIIGLTDTGDEQRAEFPYFYFVDGVNDLYLEFEREAQDAKVKLDGFEIELPKNKTTDLIPGVTIDLKKAAPGEEFAINITEDTEAIANKISDLVEQMNDVLKFIKKQNAVDANTDTSKTLGGDLMLQTLESRIRGVIFKNIQTTHGFRRFGDLGVTFQKDGLLKFDQQHFEKKVSEDFELVTQILTGRMVEGKMVPGFITHLKNIIKITLQRPAGILPSRKSTINSRIKQIDRRIAQRQRMLEQKEKNLKNKFARLEGTISKIKSSAAGLSALGASGVSPVQQLG